MKISLVIPIFNEELNIEILFKEIVEKKIYTRLDQIIYVDDYSSDSSLTILKKLEIDNKKVKILSHIKNQGQSMCLLTAARFMDGDIMITIDGDGQNNPGDINILLDKYLNDTSLSLVGGIRKKRKDNFIKIISSRLANNFRMLILRDDCPDTGCSLKVFDKNVFLSFPFFNGIHRFLPALFKGYNKKTFFMKVDHRYRLYGLSKYGTFDRLISGLKDLIRVAKIIRKFKSDHG